MTKTHHPPSAHRPLDADRSDAVRLTVSGATALGLRALHRLGYSEDEAAIIVDQLIDNGLCGYPFASLPRILAIAEDERTGQSRRPPAITCETSISALVDGGNNVGYLAVHHGTRIAIAKARASGIAAVGVHNCYFSGRNAYFAEMIVNAGFVCLHTASAKPRVLPPGAARPALGTNPICFGFPSADGPVIVDFGTASMMWGDVVLRARLGQEVPPGVGFDAAGHPSSDAEAVLGGGVAPFGEHKGYALSFAIQALGLLAGASLAAGQVRDYGFLLLVIDPALMLPDGQFPMRMSQLVAAIKATPRHPGVEEVRVPSERAFRERERRRREGLVLDIAVIESLEAL